MWPFISFFPSCSRHTSRPLTPGSPLSPSFPCFFCGPGAPGIPDIPGMPFDPGMPQYPRAKMDIWKEKNVCTADWVYVLSSLVYLLVCSGSAALSVGWWCKIFSPEQIIIHLTNAPLSSEYSHNVATGRQPCRFEAAWRQLLDTLVELLHCL